MQIDDEREHRQQQVLAGLQALSAVQSEIGRRFARSRQMHPSDAAAVVEILNAEERGEPLTPARLAKRINLTPGATSTLLNRLEEAGHIRRVREHADRRIVLLHSTAAVHESADAFYAPLTQQIMGTMSRYSEADLALVEEFVTDLRTTITAYLATEETKQAST